MKKVLISIIAGVCLVTAPCLTFGQEAISADSSQDSSQDSMQQSSEDSLQQSSDQSSEQSTQGTTDQTGAESTQQSSAGSSQDSSQQTTGGSTQATTQSTTDSSDQSDDSVLVVVTIAGAVVAVGLTAVGVTYLVEVTGAESQNVLALQDEIYAASGPEYAKLLTTFSVDEPVLVRANDEIVADGLTIRSDQDAADYLARLILKVAGGRVLDLGNLTG